MARYYKPEYVPLQDLTPKMPVEAYYNLMNQVAQNRASAEVAATKYKEDIYGIKYFDENAHKYAVGNAEELLNNTLKQDFPTPSTMANAIGRAAERIQPFKHLSEIQVEKARQADAYKLQHGIYAITSDPTSYELYDKNTNTWMRPEDIKLTTINEKDIYDLFSDSYGSNLLNSTEKLVRSDIRYMHKIEKIKGFSKEEKDALLKPGTDQAKKLATDMLNSNPELRNSLHNVYKDDREVSNALQNINYRAAFQDKYNQTKDIQYLNDEWSLYQAKKRAETPPPPKDRLFYTTPGEPDKNEINKSLGTFIAGLAGDKNVLDWSEAITGTHSWNTTSSGGISFNKDGNLAAVRYRKPTTPQERSRYGDKVPITDDNYAKRVKQLYTIKSSLDPESLKLLSKGTNKASDISDRDIIAFITAAAQNTPDFYQLSNENLSDLYEGNNFNPFSTPDGKFKNATEANLHYRDSEGKWQPVNYEQLAKETGWDDSDVANSNNNLKDQLKNSSSKTFNYRGGEPTFTGSITTPDGKSVDIKFSPSKEVAKYSKPYATVQNSLVTPGKGYNVNMQGMSITYDVAPSLTYDGYGTQKVVNVIKNLKVKVTADNQNRDNSRLAQMLEYSPAPEYLLLDMTRNYRDNNFEANQIVYKSKKEKE